MKEFNSKLGRFFVGEKNDIFLQTVEIIERVGREQQGEITIGLTGGSTPKAFYPWAVQNKALSGDLLQRAVWMTSDERCVPLASEESNFGNAERLLLEPLAVAGELRRPWAVDREPVEAAKLYNLWWNDRHGAESCFDVCFLGMGDDCHTASLFPGSSLVGAEIPDNFAAVDVPGKGWRLTITESGLSRCANIVITVTGEGKASAMQQVMEQPLQPRERPVQLLQKFSDKVTWLADEAAVAASFGDL